MFMWRTVTALGFVIAAGSLNSASAQGFDQKCEREVKELCGRVTVGRCFENESMWDQVTELCTGQIQSMVEMEHEADQQQSQERPARRQPASRGRSLDLRGHAVFGGVLREGPGTNTAKLGTTGDGDNIDILEDTGIWFDDFKWFKVDTPLGVGYQWGGIICADKSAGLEGAHVCEENVSGNSGGGSNPDESTDAADYVRNTFYTEDMLMEGLSADNEGFFTNPAIDAIKANNAPGGSCIDTNPFVDAQDFDLGEIKRTMKTEAFRGADGRMYVEVEFRNFGEKKSIEWTLAGSSGYWQVSDIEGPSGRLGKIRCP